MAVTQVAKEWTHDVGGKQYLASTSQSRISLDFVNEAFDGNDMFWATRLPLEDLQTMISHSILVGLYEVSPAMPPASSSSSPSSPRMPSPTLEETNALQMVGMARLVTDFVTFVYLDDVYVVPEHRGQGLMRWLVACCNEVVENMPHVRRTFLLAEPGGMETFYAKELGMWNISKEKDTVSCMIRRRRKVPAEPK